MNREVLAMSFDSKIDMLLKQTQKDNLRFDFNAMGQYVDGTWRQSFLQDNEGINYIPGAFAMLYAEQELKPAIYRILESKKVSLTDEIESEIQQTIRDCWQEGFPLFKWRKEKICYCFNKSLSKTLLD